jgi:hypothetical protein
MADPKGLLVVPVGFRSDGSIHALELDNSDRLKVLIDSITGSVTVIQTTPANLTVANHGWIGAAWKKQPVTIGYSAIKSEQVTNLNAAAGTNTVDSGTVPAGEIWTINNISVFNNTSNITSIYGYAIIGGVGVQIIYKAAPLASIATLYQGNLVLSPGDKISIVFFGCVAGDDLYLTYCGFMTDIDQ